MIERRTVTSDNEVQNRSSAGLWVALIVIGAIILFGFMYNWFGIFSDNNGDNQNNTPVETTNVTNPPPASTTPVDSSNTDATTTPTTPTTTNP